MRTKANQKALAFRQPKPEHGHPVLDRSIIQRLIQALMPVLLDGSPESHRTLDLIGHYLSEPGENLVEDLEDRLPEEVFITLYGLKGLLRNHSWNAVEELLANHKARFAEFIRRELEEE